MLYNYLLIIVIEYYENNNVQLNIPGFDKKSLHFNINSNQNSNLTILKKNQIDLLLAKEKEKNNAHNSKTAIVEDNYGENKIHKSNSNINLNMINFKDIEYSNIMKLKIFDDNVASKLNLNNKGSLIKKNNFNDDISLNNNNDYNVKKYNTKLSAKNKALMALPKKQSKLVFYEQKKNFGFINTNIKKERKLNIKNKNDAIDIKEIINSKKQNYSKTNNGNLNKKKISFVDIKHKQKEKQNNNYENNNSMHLELKNNSRNRNYIENDYNSIKDYINKSTDEANNIYSPKKIKINLNLLKNSNNINNNNNEIQNNINNIISYINAINNEIKIKSLTNKEKASLILSHSKILNLKERIIFSRVTEKIRSIISIKEILKSNQLFIKEKIKDLEEKIVTYNKIIETHFTPSKTAIISLNIIKKEDEENFKNFLTINNIEEKEKNYYYIYIQILYILLEDNFSEINFENIDINILYNKLSEKGFNSCKDFLYEIFILQHSTKNYNQQKMDKFSELFDKLPDFIKHQGDIKNNRFISFSYFLLHEIYIYWNKLKEFLNLKNQTQKDIDCLNQKISI